MRKIGIQEIEDIALGAALLGAGGGGDPYIGKLTAIGAVKECGEVELIGIDEVPDGAFIMPAASIKPLSWMPIFLMLVLPVRVPKRRV